MKSKAANHLHRYKKMDLAREGKPYLVYKCTKPVCTHYVPIMMSEGKLCECNRCGEAMLITKEILTGSSGRPMSRPHCGTCVKRKKQSDIAALAEFLSGNKT